jgi:hypothetical protein
LFVFRLRGVPGLAPAGDSLSFASQKKVSKEKASRSPGRFAVPCAARV